MGNLKQQGLENTWEVLHRRATMHTDKNFVGFPATTLVAFRDEKSYLVPAGYCLHSSGFLFQYSSIITSGAV